MGKSHLQGKITKNKDRGKRRDQSPKYNNKERFDIESARDYVKGLGGNLSKSGGYAKGKKLEKGDK